MRSDFEGCRRASMEYLTTAELSVQWNITPRRIGVLCAEGRIDGAIKKGKTWLIPADSKKPSDKRFNKHKAENENSFPESASKEIEV